MKPKRLLFSCLAVLVLMFGAACQTTRSPEAQIDDATITANLKAKLASEVRPQTLMNVEVNTTNGVVTLAGSVQSDEVKREAEQIARAMEGVREVQNNLQVSPPAQPQPVP